ncbi:MAG: 1-acyl-sn-glycerol-3-phosphate acyltransferase [Acidimicrobiia bacterium]|nr:1-acyl-sn-glycerol-3-phosphate acyltransferase [Acidimicrobiia bacterium]
MLSRLALWWFRLTGWKIEGELPPEPKLIVIGAPHTTNWDFVYMLATMTSFGLKASFMGKDSLFKGPFGPIMQRLGGIAIRRGVSESVVEQMAAAFAAATSLVLVIAPAGTRRFSDHWKSGFYHIARSARVPIVPARIDYSQKLVTIGPPLLTGRDLTHDMDVLRRFFASGNGKYPEQESEIRLVEESSGPSGSRAT